MAKIVKRFIEWEYEVTEDVESFNLYYKPAGEGEIDYDTPKINKPAEVGVTVYSVTLPDEIPSITRGEYAFAVSALDVNGNESDLSPTVTRFFVFVPPAAPSIIRIV